MKSVRNVSFTVNKALGEDRFAVEYWMPCEEYVHSSADIYCVYVCTLEELPEAIAYVASEIERTT